MSALHYQVETAFPFLSVSQSTALEKEKIKHGLFFLFFTMSFDLHEVSESQLSHLRIVGCKYLQNWQFEILDRYALMRSRCLIRITSDSSLKLVITTARWSLIWKVLHYCQFQYLFSALEGIGWCVEWCIFTLCWFLMSLVRFKNLRLPRMRKELSSLGPTQKQTQIASV